MPLPGDVDRIVGRRRAQAVAQVDRATRWPWRRAPVPAPSVCRASTVRLVSE